MTASTYTANKMLDLQLRGVAFPPPSRVYISLHTSDPGSTGTGEVSLTAWPAYVRKDPANGGAIATGFAVAANKATTNAQEILYPAMNGTANVDISYFAIWDAATGGNCLHTGPLVNPTNLNPLTKTLGPTDEVVIHSGTLLVAVE